MMKRRPLLILFSPFAVALFPVVHLASTNINQITQLQIAEALAVVLAATGLCFLLIRRFSQSTDFAAVATSLLAIAFFTYGRIYEVAIHTTRGWPLLGTRDGLHGALTLATALVLLVLLRGCRRRPDITEPIQLLLAVAGFVAILPSSFTLVGALEFADRPGLESLPDWIVAGEPEPPATPLDEESKATPDIYYIILDGYTRQDILEERFGFDNSDFLEALEARGFYVAKRSNSNYALTFLSIASSLNYRFMNDIAEGMLAHGDLARGPFHNLIQRPRAAEFLRARGYRYVTISTHWSGTERSAIADQTFELSRLFSSEFSNMLVRTSWLRRFAPGVAALHLFTFEKLVEISSIEGPTFAFVHFILPHSPYVFDRNGVVARDHSLVQFAKPRMNASDATIEAERRHLLDQIEASNARRQSKTQQRRWADYEELNPEERERRSRGGYVGQMIYTNRRILESIDRILAESDVDPIIILQGDHGTAETGGPGGKGPHPRERMAILNAYRVPEKMRRKLRPDITPVNSFRLLFNALFDAGLEKLPDHSFYSWYDNTYLIEPISPRALRKPRSTLRSN